MKRNKTIIAYFSIAKYGGIIEHIVSKVEAIKKLGKECDIVEIGVKKTDEKKYEKKINLFKDGSFQKNLVLNSEFSSYEYDSVTGYYKNNYHGFYLPPSNYINIFEENALQKWYSMLENVELVIWNFLPTKNKIWVKGGLPINFWWKFLDLPSEIKQIFTVHDAFFDIRASHISAFKEKILFLECAHIAAFQCCKNFNIPRILLPNSRCIDKKVKFLPFSERKINFFAAHIFKPIKKMDLLVRAIYHLNEDFLVAGVGIEQAYMSATDKIKDMYVAIKKYDPDIKEEDIGKSIWSLALERGMEYVGLLDTKSVNTILNNCKFAVDLSYSEHYAQYCKTHINGFIIEAMLRGSYPIIVNYGKKVEDPIYDSLSKIVIPYDATPKQVAMIMKSALSMSEKKYQRGIENNYLVANELFNTDKVVKEIYKYINLDKAVIYKKLSVGKDSEKVVKITNDIMTNFFNIELPLKFETM